MKSLTLATKLAASFVCLASTLGGSLAKANQFDFVVGSNRLGINQAYVTVTVCSPDHQRCEEIDGIRLDTGSEGLKIKASLLRKLNLEPISTSQGEEVIACSRMAGKVGFLGPLAHASVTIGDMTAPDVIIGLADEKLERPGVSCSPFPSDGSNGILGIAAAVHSREGKTNFACSESGCRPFNPGLNEQTANPIAKFPEHNNGFIVRIGRADKPASRVKGRIIFGIGTAPNNQPSPNLSRCTGTGASFFTFRYNNKLYSARPDTGTYSYLLPWGQRKIPYCKGHDDYLCPDAPTVESIEILNSDLTPCSKIEMPIISYAVKGNLSFREKRVLPSLGSSDANLAEMFSLGMPFFYGRDVYLVLAGASSSLGRGPLVAF